MARIRKANSKLSYGGLGLTKEEDRKLLQKLHKEDISLKKQLRKLIRKWLKSK